MPQIFMTPSGAPLPTGTSQILIESFYLSLDMLVRGHIEAGRELWLAYESSSPPGCSGDSVGRAELPRRPSGLVIGSQRSSFLGLWYEFS